MRLKHTSGRGHAAERASGSRHAAADAAVEEESFEGKNGAMQSFRVTVRDPAARHRQRDFIIASFQL